MRRPVRARRVPAGAHAGAAPHPPRALRAALAAVFVVLCATAGERTLGVISDEQQMLATAVAMVEEGELGIAKGQLFSLSNREGDAVSPYGMGLSLVEAPVVLACGAWETAFGARSSQSLFVLLGVLLVIAAAGAAGLLARALGAPPAGEALAALATGLGSPLWAYPQTALSEPLQAATIGGAAALASLSVSEAKWARLLRAGAGFLAGWAVLTKGVNLALLPFLALPVALDRVESRDLRGRARAVAEWAAGLAAPLSLWLFFEVVRFGAPLSAYAKQGQGFTHPPLDGLWRLLVGPNKGLLLYVPLLAVSAAALVGLVRRPERRGTGLAVAGGFGTLLATSSAWWAWDGASGWGPRLLVPAVPLLAGAAAASLARPLARRLALLAAGLGVAVNLLGVLQADAATQHYVDAAGPVRLSAEEARRFPSTAVAEDGASSLPLRRSAVSNLDAAFSPLRLHAFLLGVRLGSESRFDAERRLGEAPWLSRHPEARPRLAFSPGTYGEILTGYLLDGFRWPHLFSVLRAGEAERRAGYNGAYDVALADQVGRLLDLGRGADAERLARKLDGLAPSGFSAAYLAEALRVGGKREELRRFVEGLPASSSRSPLVSIVQALLARDEGDATGAAFHLERAARSAPLPALVAARREPPERWPSGLRAFLALEPPRPAQPR